MKAKLVGSVTPLTLQIGGMLLIVYNSLKKKKEDAFLVLGHQSNMCNISKNLKFYFYLYFFLINK